jgi:hypothetical protein
MASMGDEEAEREPQLWFGKKEGRLGFGPITKEGRIAVALYVLLLLVAVLTYSQLALTVFVGLFYTLVFGFVVVFKSDIMKHIQ